MKNLRHWLPLVAALLAVGVAWGQNKSDVDNLSDRLTKAEQTQDSVNKLATTQAVIETRTQHIEHQVVETRRLLEKLTDELLRRRDDVR